MNGHASPEADSRATGGLTPHKMFSFVVIIGNSTLSGRETRVVVLMVAVRGKGKKSLPTVTLVACTCVLFHIYCRILNVPLLAECKYMSVSCKKDWGRQNLQKVSSKLCWVFSFSHVSAGPKTPSYLLLLTLLFQPTSAVGPGG